ncbi:MotA/TolQ/ExbB proton channel family protein [Maricurvus nonylphenolicus]|uniref:MotA/TolQ/ExbB proton channel family protein n=1 Tax=Maricurvus nonylphenolicus TaxID=1008307 RepID=UPI0036F23D0E
MLQAHLLTAGPIIYPLIFCSVLVGALVLERLITHCFYPVVNAEALQRQFLQGDISDVDIDSRKGRGLRAGLALLAHHADAEKSLREERLGLWLQEQRQYLLLRTRWLNLLGAVAPLLGLLGTVLGIITMFQDVAHQNGPVTPALLAGGMWEAMATTAAGLIIAIPALCAGQLLSFWADRRIEVMQNVLNHCSLSLSLKEESAPSAQKAAASVVNARFSVREEAEREQFA